MGETMWRTFRSPKWLVPSLPLRRRSVLGHVLRENVARRNSFDEQRTDIADHGRDPIAFFEGVAGAHGNGFLAQAGIQSADDLILPEQPHHALFELAIELHEVIEVQVLFPR